MHSPIRPTRQCSQPLPPPLDAGQPATGHIQALHSQACRHAASLHPRPHPAYEGGTGLGGGYVHTYGRFPAVWTNTAVDVLPAGLRRVSIQAPKCVCVGAPVCVMKMSE